MAIVSSTSSRPSLRVTTLALASLLVSATALAEPKDDARRHFGEGLRAAQDGRYEDALRSFLAAQDAYPHPSTLYNIAKAYQDLGDLETALTYYELFADAAPDKANDVAPVIQVLRARLSREQRVSEPVASTTTTTPPAAAPSAGATADELERLADIAAQLEAFAKSMQERAAQAALDAQAAADTNSADAPVATDADPSAPTPSDDLDADIPEIQGDFLAEAYERVVITASRVGQDPLDSPSTLTVLTSEDIRLSGAISITDILRRVVGVDVMHPAVGNADISIRGFNRELNNKVLVLVDGRTIYQDFLATTIWPSIPVALEEIERIEVIRGPGSAVYGANALTGVINIITRTPGEGPAVTATATAGTPGVGRGAAVVSGRKGADAYRFSVSFDQHDRWASPIPLTPNNTVPDDVALTPFTEDQRRGMFRVAANGRLDHTFSDKAFLSVSGGYSESLSELQNIGALGNYGFDLRHFYVRADASYEPVILRAFWNSDHGEVGPWLEDANSNFTLRSPVENDIIDLEIEAPLEFQTGPIKHTLNIGGGYRYKRFAFGYFAGGFDTPYEENHYKLFINEQASIGKLKAVGSIRVDASPWLALRETISPRGALIYRLFDKTSIRATGGTSFRAPNAVENYMDFALPVPANGAFIRDLGSTSLSPERIATVELGVHDESTLYHQADISVYYNRLTSLIFLDSVTPGITPYDPTMNGFMVGETGWINTPDIYQGIGVEAELETYPTDGLDIFANANLLTILETNADGETVVDQSTSNLKLNAGFSYRTPFRTDFTFTSHYVSRQVWRLREFDAGGSLSIVEREIPARLLMSARIAGRPLAKDDLEIGLTIFNLAALFGEGQLEHPNGQPLGARVLGHAAYRF